MKVEAVINKTKKSKKKLYKLIAEYAAEKKAEDILVLDMRNIVNFCDYFVICSGNTDRHVRAIADNIEYELEKQGMKIELKQGVRKSDWIVFDAGDVVTHVFQKDSRKFYNLEYLWQAAKVVDLKI